MTKAINLKMQQEHGVVWFTNANTPIDEVKVVVGNSEINSTDLKDVNELFHVNLTFREFEYFLSSAMAQAENVRAYLNQKAPKANMYFGEKEKPSKKKTEVKSKKGK